MDHRFAHNARETTAFIGHGIIAAQLRDERLCLET